MPITHLHDTRTNVSAPRSRTSGPTACPWRSWLPSQSWTTCACTRGQDEGGAAPPPGVDFRRVDIGINKKQPIPAQAAGQYGSQGTPDGEPLRCGAPATPKLSSGPPGLRPLL